MRLRVLSYLNAMPFSSAANAVCSASRSACLRSRFAFFWFMGSTIKKCRREGIASLTKKQNPPPTTPNGCSNQPMEKQPTACGRIPRWVADGSSRTLLSSLSGDWHGTFCGGRGLRLGVCLLQPKVYEMSTTRSCFYKIVDKANIELYIYTMKVLKSIITDIGIRKISKACGVSYEAVRKWGAKGKLPRTEWTGETRYCEQIIKLSNNKLTREQLLRGGARASGEAGAVAAPERNGCEPWA
jgi:hypothetical protein